jgi:hypothetical protein
MCAGGVYRCGSRMLEDEARRVVAFPDDRGDYQTDEFFSRTMMRT